jgi:hypothetical protein
MLFSTGLLVLQVVDTELQQSVFNNLRQTCCDPRKAPYEALCIHYFEQKMAKQVAIFWL